MRGIVPIVVTASLAWPGAALAEGSNGCSSQNQTYGSQDCQVINNNASRTTATATNTGSLPFTGLDVGLLAVGGGTLVGAGLVVRRLSRSAE